LQQSANLAKIAAIGAACRSMPDAGLACGGSLVPSEGMTTAFREPSAASRAQAGGPAVTLRNVSKQFRLPHEQYHTLKERALHVFRTRTFDVLQAVDDVSVDIRPGEFFGIVGRNGSGKSTLLKCLAGIYDIDQGTLVVEGRLSPFIELGVGFNPDLTARDNVIVNAVMLGLTRKQALERFDDIVAFAELEEFIDLKLKNFSSGMYVRLAFATAVQVDAEILLIDEVLAVGDAAFQQKCFDEFVRLKEAGRTILFVTHDMGSVERFCDRAMLLERGRVVNIGEPATVAREYNELNFRRIRTEAKSSAAAPVVLRRSPVAEVLSARFESPGGDVLVTAEQSAPCQVRVEVRFLAETHDPIFAVSLINDSGHTAFATSTQVKQIETGSFSTGDTAVVRIPFENWLAPGRYRLTATVARDGLGNDIFDLHAGTSIIVLASRAGGGVVDLPHSFEIERSPTRIT
jgi:ABC-type polysaccharide/polyol phosphate transport system ATPase subunit